MIAFGPIPSRRLGRSLGINHVPAKTCSYACVYCQVGRTTRMTVKRQSFYGPECVFGAVRDRTDQLKAAGEEVDYLSFVPDGEPTLDADLGRMITMLRPLGYRIAVISNASLIWREDVRADLGLADWVSLKVDGVDEAVWRKVSRPHPDLDLRAILSGIRTFARTFKGKLVTETMLVRGANDSTSHIEAIGAFLADLKPATGYLSVPTRPPAEAVVRAPEAGSVNLAYQILGKHLESVELLMGYEGDAFASSGDAEHDILSITAVHPMREQAVRSLIARTGAEWRVVERLIEEGHLLRADFEGDTFYMRQLPSRRRAQ
jgi:wyosine [tRNA(Phe)-imidazoG37] synthetase (radical SAM superfamily)